MTTDDTRATGEAFARESWFVSMLSGTFSDLRLAARRLGKSPGFAAVTLLTLMLCIGFNTAIFSLVYGLMLKPMPFPQPERIVEIYNTFVKAGLNKAPSNVVQYLDYKQTGTSYEKLGLWTQNQGMFGEDGTLERIYTARATADFFEVLGLNPVVGRFFTLDNSRPNEDFVAVLSQSFWQAKFNEDPAIIGKQVRIDGDVVTIVGVAPRALEAFDARVGIVRPLGWDPARLNPNGRFGLNPQLFGRLKAGVSLGEAKAEAETIEKRFIDGAPAPTKAFAERAGHKIGVDGMHAERVKPMETQLYLLQGGVVFVLLIGCVNIANLLLTRANGRQAELAIRCALGAGRAVIARQLLIESFLLTAIGAALGLGLAWGAVKAINYYMVQMMPNMLPTTLDARMLGFTAGVSLVVALFIGALPVVHILRTNLMELIHSSSRGASGGMKVRLVSSLLVVAQVGVTLLPLTGAGLLIRSFANALAVNPGMEVRGVVTGRLVLTSAYRGSDDAAKGIQDRLLAALNEIPGVTSATMSFATPFQGGLPLNALTLADDALPPGSPQPGSNRVIVWPSYAETMKLSLVEGRFFEPTDMAPGKRVFVVDEAFARKFFPNRSALGGRFAFGGRPEKESDWPTVIGVVKNVPHNGVEDRSGVPFIYQLPGGRPGAMTLFVRTTRPTADTVAAMREKLRQIDPALPFFDTGALSSFVDSSYNQRRAVMLLIGAFGCIALFLSAVGIYGVLAYDVSQRTREIGIRGALGASHGEVIGMILRQGLWKTGAGLVLGLGGALLLSRYMETLLFDVKRTDPLAYVSVSLLLLAVAALASFLPARRAAKINPIEALRVE